MMYVLVKTKKDLEGYYFDEDSDAWEYEEEYHEWSNKSEENNQDSADEVFYCVLERTFGTMIDFDREHPGMDVDCFRWAFDGVYTKDTHPEYYL